ncbi:hypothetical protein ACIRU3_00250 [Streptomyces sp. NPDC101151]|uniref:hypothetical protein n=1 Tax=Streptomyces sp. NPDC101151 TaxID=3366115 RepID=UPI003820C84F
MAKDEDQPGWLSALERCGLQVLRATVPQDVPSVTAAVHAVTGIEVEPVAVIPESSPHATDELDRLWHHHAANCSLYGDDGEFFILPPVSGGSRVGWVRVSDSVGRNLPSRMAVVSGSPEFLAVSADGRHMCAASVEECDYWVVVHEF